MDLKGRKIGIGGLGKRTGAALVRYLCDQGAQVLVYDDQDEKALKDVLVDLGEYSFELVTQSFDEKKFMNCDLFILSPGVSIHTSWVKKLKSMKCEVVSELEFSFRQTQVPMVAITGTNGKSTTTELLGDMLKADGMKVFVGGNLGRPLVEVLNADYDVVVVEVSSFQLEAVAEFHPRIGVILNISEDHLDRHHSMQTYVSCKKSLFAEMGPDDLMILKADDSWIEKFRNEISAAKEFFSSSSEKESQLKLERSSITFNDGAQVSLEGWTLPGQHNIENLMAALLAARRLGCSSDAMEKGLKNFTALEHRLEIVAEVKGVTFVNDSKSTTPDSTVRALDAFSNSILLLAGGKSKKGNFATLTTAAERSVRKAFLYGESAEELKTHFKPVRNSVFETMRQAFEEAAGETQKGDTILLSPACASFDQYPNYEARGLEFRNLVQAFKEGQL